MTDIEGGNNVPSCHADGTGDGGTHDAVWWNKEEIHDDIGDRSAKGNVPELLMMTGHVQ